MPGRCAQMSGAAGRTRGVRHEAERGGGVRGRLRRVAQHAQRAGARRPRERAFRTVPMAGVLGALSARRLLARRVVEQRVRPVLRAADAAAVGDAAAPAAGRAALSLC